MNCFADKYFNAIAQLFVGGASNGSSEKISKSCPINMVTKSHDLMINSNFLWRTAPKLTKGKTGLQIDDITLRNNVYNYKLQPCRIQISNGAKYKIQHIVWGYITIRKKNWASNHQPRRFRQILSLGTPGVFLNGFWKIRNKKNSIIYVHDPPPPLNTSRLQFSLTFCPPPPPLFPKIMLDQTK